jgi:hypothetical protein
MVITVHKWLYLELKIVRLKIIYKLKTKPMLNKKLIQRLRDGKIAVKNDGTIEDLNEILKEAFPNTETIGIWDFYYAVEKEHYWGCDSTTTLPIYSVKDFFTDAEQEKTFPRVMLVNDVNDIDTSIPRVVFMIKNGKYLAWNGADTLEKSENVTDNFPWSYAWEVEDANKQTFPITITETQYNELTEEQKQLINQITQTK